MMWKTYIKPKIILAGLWKTEFNEKGMETMRDTTGMKRVIFLGKKENTVEKK